MHDELDINREDQFAQLLMAMTERELCVEEHRQLAMKLNTDEEAQDEYLDYILLHSDLNWGQPINQLQEAILKEIYSEASSNDSSDFPQTSSSVFGMITQKVSKAGRFMAQPFPLSIVVAFFILINVLIALALLSVNDKPNENPMVNREEQRQQIQQELAAVITSLEGCRWQSGVVQRKRGDLLYNGESVNLQEGIIQITFRNGVVALLQGPAHIRLDSQISLTMLSGKSTFTISDRMDYFEVNTAAARIIDLGTRFGVFVDKNETTLVQVKQGKVEVFPRKHDKSETQKKYLLTAGEAIRVTLNQAVGHDAPKDTHFVWAKNSQEEGYYHWQRRSEKLRKDPSLLAYYTFENQRTNPKVLLNQAVATQGQLTGTLGQKNADQSSPRWTAGRWNSKGALAFLSKQQQKVIVPDWTKFKFDQAFTVATWVRLDRERHMHTIVSDFDEPIKDTFFHVSVVASGVRFIVNPGGGSTQHPTEHNKMRVGQWHFVVCSCVLPGGEKKMYLDGVQVYGKDTRYKKNTFPKSLSPLVLGGKLNKGTCFEGAIDELAIFNRELSGKEIKNMYQAGKPTATKE